MGSCILRLEYHLGTLPARLLPDTERLFALLGKYTRDSMNILVVVPPIPSSLAKTCQVGAVALCHRVRSAPREREQDPNRRQH
jgi:hypothetical protein